LFTPSPKVQHFEMNFRCRTQKGTEHLRSIDKNFTLAQLRQIIEEKFGIPKHAQKRTVM
jgi:hypothetical protein